MGLPFQKSLQGYVTRSGAASINQVSLKTAVYISFPVSGDIAFSLVLFSQNTRTFSITEQSKIREKTDVISPVSGDIFFSLCTAWCTVYSVFHKFLRRFLA